MEISKTTMTTSLVLAESCYLYPLYQIICLGVEAEIIVQPFTFLTLAAFSVLVNLVLKKGSYRNATIFGTNLLLLLFLLLIAMGARTVFVPPPTGEFVAWVGYLFSIILVALIWLRGLRLARREDIEVFGQFDKNIALTFLLFLLISMTGLDIPGSKYWLSFSFLLNLAAVAVKQSAEGSSLEIPQWVVIGPAAVFFAAAVLSQFFLPALQGPAQVVYDIVTPVASFFTRAFLFVLVAVLRAAHMAPQASSESNGAAVMSGEMSESEMDTTLLDLFLSIIFVVFGVILVLVLLAIIIYLCRLFYLWLLKRQEPGLRAEKGRRKIFFLQTLKEVWQRLLAGLYYTFLPWLPAGISAALAYQALLRWAAYRNCPRREQETPYEYYGRLRERFPKHREELRQLTEYYVEHKYGQKKNRDKKELKALMRKLYFPRFISGNRNLGG